MSPEDKLAEKANVVAPPEPGKEAGEKSQEPAALSDVQVIVGKSEGSAIGQLPVTEALKTAGEVRGQAGVVLLYTVVGMLEADLRDAREERKGAHQEAMDWQKKYYEERESRGRLEERLRMAERVKLLQKVLLTCGGLMVAAGWAYARQGQSDVGLGLAVVGGVFLIGGWFWRDGHEPERG
ncbi:MAG TPA: hypothetical protein VMP11_12275 [Verrucomicrobiae bacterium]|nr:hypothetical protein [Verrucomicrobiae bacterium]